MSVPFEAVRRFLIRIAVLLAALATQPVLAHHSPLHFAGSATELLEPGIVFFDARGREIKGLRVIGYQNADRFLKALETAGGT